jgi:hypothetical protein
MIITVRRFLSNDDATLSEVKIDGVRQCYGLEDEHREVKVYGETRIPAGAYKIGIRAEGGFHNRYSKKFADIHQGMLQVLDVPGFEFILIHVGNTEANTAGCLLVGKTCVGAGDTLTVGSSVAAYKALYQKVIGAALAGDLVIHYIDEDR